MAEAGVRGHSRGQLDELQAAICGGRRADKVDGSQFNKPLTISDSAAALTRLPECCDITSGLILRKVGGWGGK